jgi:hypothetical protein
MFPVSGNQDSLPLTLGCVNCGSDLISLTLSLLPIPLGC